MFGQPSCRNRLCLVRCLSCGVSRRRINTKDFFSKKKKSPSVVVKILLKKLKILLKIELFVAVKRCSRVAGNKAAE